VAAIRPDVWRGHGLMKHLTGLKSDASIMGSLGKTQWLKSVVNEALNIFIVTVEKTL
jgi:hypothetical protein